MITHEIALTGCTPEPMMGYLKALGVLRLVAEQKDPGARGCWRDGAFTLQSTLDSVGLNTFFLEEYRPTPFIAPWGARSGFFEGSSEKTAREALDAMCKTVATRFARFRSVIADIRALLSNVGIDEKASDELKLLLLQRCRASLSDDLLDWLDTTYILTADGRSFPPLLGTGGNEGSGSYVSGFAQLVVSCLLHRKHDRNCLASFRFPSEAGHASHDGIQTVAEA